MSISSQLVEPSSVASSPNSTGARSTTNRSQKRLRLPPHPVGAFFHVFAHAEFERNLIRERTVAGLKAARAAALPEARPFKLSPKEIKTTRTLLKSADIPVAEIAAHFYMVRPTLPHALHVGLVKASGERIASPVTVAEFSEAKKTSIFAI